MISWLSRWLAIALSSLASFSMCLISCWPRETSNLISSFTLRWHNFFFFFFQTIKSCAIWALNTELQLKCSPPSIPPSCLLGTFYEAHRRNNLLLSGAADFFLCVVFADEIITLLRSEPLWANSKMYVWHWCGGLSAALTLHQTGWCPSELIVWSFKDVELCFNVSQCLLPLLISLRLKPINAALVSVQE